MPDDYGANYFAGLAGAPNSSALSAAGGLVRPNFRRLQYLGATGSGATSNVAEGLSVVGTFGNVAPTAANPWPFMSAPSAATLNAQASATGGQSILWSQKPLFQGRVYVPTPLTVLRVNIGLATTWATLLANDLPGSVGLISGAAFRWSTAVPDTNWQCMTFNGAGQTVIDSGVAPVVGVSQKFEISDDGTTTTFKINGATVGSTTLTRPAGSTLLRQGCGVQTLEAVLKNIAYSWLYTDVDG